MGPALDLLTANLLSPVVLAFGLGLLARGKARRLTDDEVAALRRAAGMIDGEEKTES